MGLPVDKAEIDRVLAVPLDMLCSPRYARLKDSYSPTNSSGEQADHDDENWSEFTCKSLSVSQRESRGMCAPARTASHAPAMPRPAMIADTGPLFHLGSTVGKLAADNDRTQPVIWGLTARILSEYLHLLVECED